MLHTVHAHTPLFLTLSLARTLWDIIVWPHTENVLLKDLVMARFVLVVRTNSLSLTSVHLGESEDDGLSSSRRDDRQISQVLINFVAQHDTCLPGHVHRMRHMKSGMMSCNWTSCVKASLRVFFHLTNIQDRCVQSAVPEKSFAVCVSPCSHVCPCDGVVAKCP